MLLHHENKRFVVVRVQVGHLHARLLLLSDPLPLGVEELDLDVGVARAGDVHLLEFLTFQDTDGELQNIIIRFITFLGKDNPGNSALCCGLDRKQEGSKF